MGRRLPRVASSAWRELQARENLGERNATWLRQFGMDVSAVHEFGCLGLRSEGALDEPRDPALLAPGKKVSFMSFTEYALCCDGCVCGFRGCRA